MRPSFLLTLVLLISLCAHAIEVEKALPFKQISDYNTELSKSIFTQLWGDFISWITGPTNGKFITLVGDIAMFFALPYFGGYMRLEARRQYLMDQNTYDNAQVTELMIFQDSLAMIKQKFWQVLGKIPRGN